MSFLSHFPFPFHVLNGLREDKYASVHVYMYADKGPTTVLSVRLHVDEAICARKQNEMRKWCWKRRLCRRDGSCIREGAEISVPVDGERVTLICGREWRMFIDAGWGR